MIINFTNYNMTTLRMLSPFIIATTLINLVLSLEVRVISNEAVFNAKDQQDYNNLKLVINSNNNYLYPYQKNIFLM